MNNHQPTVIVILGGGGDLAKRKLFPALFDLYIQNNLPQNVSIIGIARTLRTDAEYQQLVHEAILKQHSGIDATVVQEFCTYISYISGSFVDTTTYDDLKQSITTLEEKSGAVVNRLFYLAVPPLQYEAIFKNLHTSTLAQQEKGSPYWARVLVEKPFGNDYDSALALDMKLSSLYSEDQILRIDHYLAKEAVMNILSFRFANRLLSSPWNKDFIKEVKITMHESIGAESRGAFYDTVGALRDVGQNHLLQILALIAMEEPETFKAEDIRSRRAQVLQKLILMTEETVATNVVRAQYENYTDAVDVDEKSQTETYFEFKAYIDDEVWRDVPFYISAGKALKKEQVVVELLFHDITSGPFATKEKMTTGDSIILTISPVQSMNITLNVKKPGHSYTLETNTLSYEWSQENEKGYTAYEKVFRDSIVGDQTLFTKTEEVLASWKFITSITDVWDNVPLQKYERGSEGPQITLST